MWRRPSHMRCRADQRYRIIAARSPRQECLIYRARNVLTKVTATAQEEIRAATGGSSAPPRLLPPGQARAPAGHRCAGPRRRVRREVRHAVPHRSPLHAVRLRVADQLRAVSRRASQADRHSKPPSAPSGRPAAESRPSAACPARPAAATSSGPSRQSIQKLARLTTSHGTRQIQDLRRSLPDPPIPSAPPTECRSHRLTSITKEPSRRHLHQLWDAARRNPKLRNVAAPGTADTR
jgi:hypothetical protein